MGIQIKRIGHVGILVSDFEKSFKFYTEVMGCKVTNRRKRPDGGEGLSLDSTRRTMISLSPARRRELMSHLPSNLGIA